MFLFFGFFWEAADSPFLLFLPRAPSLYSPLLGDVLRQLHARLIALLLEHGSGPGAL